MKATDAALAYIWATKPEDVRAAEEALKAERAAGVRSMTPGMTAVEQRRAGMPPPSQRAAAAGQKPATQRRELKDYSDAELGLLEERISDEQLRRLEDSAVYEEYAEDEDDPNNPPENIDMSNLSSAGQAAAELVQGAARLQQ